MSADRPSLDALRIDRSSARSRESSGGKGWLVVALLLLAAGAAGWWFWGRAPVAEVVTAQVRSEAAATGAARTLLNGSGYVTARRAATVSSKVTGKVLEVLTEEGKIVEEGQILARLDGANVAASLRLAEAQLESAHRGVEEIQANLAFAEKEFARYSGLIKTNAASQSDLNRAEAEARALAARLHKHTADITVAERQVAEWQQQLDDTVIRAPFGGVVTSKNAQPGEMISPMSVGGFTRTGICTIVDMTSLEIEVDVNESFINRVQPGQPVQATLDSYPDAVFAAKVIAIIPTADRQKATVKVRVGFEKLDPRILPDMAVKVAFQSAPSAEPAEAASPARTLIVPKEAVQDDGGRSIVWIVNNGRAERRAVTVGQTTGEETTLTAGVSGGETVVLRSSAPLRDGQKVKATP